MATIKFILQSKSNPANIYVRFIDGRKVDVQTKTNYVINPDDWSESKQKPKNLKITALKNLDVDLQELRTNLVKHYNNSAGKEVNLQWLKDFINPEIKNEIPKNLIDYINFYKECRKNEVTRASMQKWEVVKAKMQRFEKHRKKQIAIIDINEKLLKEFIEFYKANNYSKNTMHRELVFIKTFCKHAKRKGVEVHLEMDGLKLERDKVTFVYLTFEELEKIQKTDFENPDYTIARDWLVISCYTGQRVSDFLRFDKSMIREQSGKMLIEFEQVKTKKIVTLPLHPKVIEILNLRGGDFPPKQFDQDYNKHLKKVCEIAKINEVVFGSKMNEVAKGEFRKVAKEYPKYELVSSHIGRRSFASNFYGKIPTSLLISATGHSTEEMFLNYIGKSNSDRALELSNYF